MRNVIEANHKAENTTSKYHKKVEPLFDASIIQQSRENHKIGKHILYEYFINT